MPPFKSFYAAYALFMYSISVYHPKGKESPMIGNDWHEKDLEKDHENQIFKIIEYKALGLIFLT